MFAHRFKELLRAGALPWAVAEGKGSSAPAAPDYRGAAESQAQSGKENLTMQTWANRPTINTPMGQMAWEAGAGVDPSSGQPITKWTGNLNLTPQQQQALDSQQAITAGRSGAAQQLLGQATSATATPFNWAGLPQRAGTPGARETQATTQASNEAGFGQQRSDIQNALFEQMRPEHQRQESGARSRLANMGLSPGSEAYNRELERLQGTQAGERFNAMQTAGQEQARLNQMLLSNQQQAFGQNLGANAQNFGQNLQGAQFQNLNRQAAITEEAQRRGMPLSELNALLSGQQVNMPTMPSFNLAQAAPATQYLNAAQQQGNYNLDAAKLAQSGGTDWGSLIGAVGGGIASNPAAMTALASF